MKSERADAGEPVVLAAGRAASPDSGWADLVLDLGQVGRGDFDRVGGKGANLGELIRAGFPVPAGFVVTTAAYDRVVAHHRVGEIVDRALREGDGPTLRSAFDAAPMPPEVERDILAAYRQLGDGPVAVRSSATAEDLPEAAFAGQQDTFLNVVGADALLAHIRRCWASLWTDRAIAYRARLGLDQRAVKLAVVVQRMVPADVAGVLFTANPVTGARDEVVIDASPGLGEAVVSGLVTPDHYVLRKGRLGWHIVERRLGQREVIIRAVAGGGTEHVAGTAAAAGAEPALPDWALHRLARLGAAIERHFGAPQDVEWAWAGGEPFIVQARPITALPVPPPRPSRPVRMMAAIVAEMLPVRPYPLEATTWGLGLVLSAVLAPMFRLLGLAVHVDDLFVEEDGVVVRLSGRLPIRPTLGVLLAPVRLARLARRYDPAQWHTDPLLAEMDARVFELKARGLRELSWAGLLATADDALAIPSLIGELRLRYFPRAALAMARVRLVLALVGRGDLFGTLVFTGVETKVIQANRALEALAARVRSDPDLADLFARHDAATLWTALEAHAAGRAFLADLRAFLEEYGHREAGATLLLSKATWKDAPDVVLSILKGLARTEPRPQRGPPAWQVARDELLDHPLLRIPPLRAAFIRALAEARHVHQLREDTRFLAMLPLPVLRQALLEFGRRLAAAGVLDAPEDVFHLTLVELRRIDGASAPPAERAAELRALVGRRMAKRAALEGTPLVDPRLLRQDATADGALVRGIPGSPGVAEGPVRVVRDTSDFGTLRAGEVLVAPYTNPAWTPLFERAAAVVVDSGGPASHAAIVAREYGIPAVMATVDGTQRLTEGEWVRVDGNRGLVFDAAAPATRHDVPGQN